jgi:hypothetical protein
MFQIFLAIVAAVALIALPIVMIRSMVLHFRTPPSKRRSGGSASTAVAAALQELDRLVARPSVEHTVETQKELPRLDDQSDD